MVRKGVGSPLYLLNLVIRGLSRAEQMNSEMEFLERMKPDTTNSATEQKNRVPNNQSGWLRGIAGWLRKGLFNDFRGKKNSNLDYRTYEIQASNFRNGLTAHNLRFCCRITVFYDGRSTCTER